jgi:solute carrier family 25 phosphate transporter 23/24/25/41
VAPSLAINYAAYETLRSMWLESSDRHSPTVPMSLACGSAAGLVSSTATFPLDLVRRRLQLGRAAPATGRAAPAPATYAAVVRQVVAAGGLRGFYAGIIPEYMKVIPGVAIAFATYELAKKTLHVQTNSTDR